MYHFFTDQNAVYDDHIEITGADFNHITHVLRMKKGEEITIGIIGSTKEYLCRIDAFEADRVLCLILDQQTVSTELPSKITLFQGLPKADKMELIIQKAVELGAAKIVPVAMARSVVKLDDKKAASKVVRWQGISEAAAKQSKRGIIPVVSAPLSFSEAIKEAGNYDHILVPYEDARGFAHTREVLKSLKSGESIAVFIGPEGGFAPTEIEKARESGAEILTLGKRILRTETAGLVALSLIMAELEE
ncbi:MAG: 16S rRNA (uracil(1498)-N(3))-methyltransferase [Lachnospiraceae bacterium]|nr:16S rRNA (uracil(1498)-N(3))-methyltransferase [Lachnospiraceae bacterium]